MAPARWPACCTSRYALQRSWVEQVCNSLRRRRHARRVLSLQRRPTSAALACDPICGVQGQSLVSPSAAQIVFCTIPIWSALLAAAVLPGEPVGQGTWLGGAVVAAAGLVAATGKRPAAAEQQQAAGEEQQQQRADDKSSKR